LIELVLLWLVLAALSGGKKGKKGEGH